MNDEKETAISEGGIGQSASTGGLERMTFTQWWHSKYPAQADEAEFILIREAWEAAALAEREACATVAEEFEDDMGDGKAQKIADAIRMRSND